MDIWRYSTQGFKYQQYRPVYPQQLFKNSIETLVNRDKYLDVATGTGRVLMEYCPYFKEVKGIDISDQMITVAESNITKYRETYENCPKITLKKCSILDYKEDEKFDLITVGEALHYFSGEQTLRKLKGMLNQGGMLIIFAYILDTVKSQNQKQNDYYYEFYSQLYPYFAFNIKEIHQHYNDQEKYPFEKLFQKVDKMYLKPEVPTTKEEYISHLKTYSSYNILREKEGTDPIVDLENRCAEKVTCVFDFFRVRCFK